MSTATEGTPTDGAPADSSGPKAAQKVTVVTLTAMVVGGMVGAGVFSLPRRFATETGIYGALIAWFIAGAGMLMLAFVFQTFGGAQARPRLRRLRLRQGGVR